MVCAQHNGDFVLIALYVLYIFCVNELFLKPLVQNISRLQAHFMAFKWHHFTMQAQYLCEFMC